MGDHKDKTLTRNPTRKLHLQSSFASMMVDYMSGDELSKHLRRQMSLQNEKNKEPEPVSEEAKEPKKKLKKQQTHHGMILQGSEQQLQRVKTKPSLQEKDVLDDEEQENLKKLKEKEHDELVQGLLMLRDYYKAEYKKALQEKVEHQRKIIQERQNKLEEQAKISQEHEEKMRHKVTCKLPRSVLVSDSQFRDGLQTGYYKIISLENKLKNEGYLNRSHEAEEFWDFITVPENLESVMEDGDLTRTWERIKNYHKEHKKVLLAAQAETGTPVKPKPGARKKHSFKSATAASTWRSTTHGIRTILTPSNSPGGRKSSSFVSGGKRSKKTPPASAIPIEQRFPKVEFPPLAAYRLEFGETEPDPEEVRKQEEALMRLEARNGLKRTLNTMFSHALANRAATRRLMDKNEDYNFENLSGAAGFVEFHELATAVQLKHSGSTNKKHLLRRSSGKSSDVKSHVGSRKSADQRCKILETDNVDRSDSNMSISSKEGLVVELPPLTLEQLSSDCLVKEAKCLSTFWVNPVAKHDWNTGEVS